MRTELWWSSGQPAPPASGRALRPPPLAQDVPWLMGWEEREAALALLTDHEGCGGEGSPPGWPRSPPHPALGPFSAHCPCLRGPHSSALSPFPCLSEPISGGLGLPFLEAWLCVALPPLAASVSTAVCLLDRTCCSTTASRTGLFEGSLANQTVRCERTEQRTFQTLRQPSTALLLTLVRAMCNVKPWAYPQAEGEQTGCHSSAWLFGAAFLKVLSRFDRLGRAAMGARGSGEGHQPEHCPTRQASDVGQTSIKSKSMAGRAWLSVVE